MDAATREELLRRQRAVAAAANAGTSVRVAVAKAYIREFADRLCGGGCVCGARGPGRPDGRFFSTRGSAQEAREDFQNLISFLALIPLFRKQLPKAELPRVASALRRTVWQPGERVIEQGKVGKAFFIIQSGEASVVVQEAGGQDTTRATLYHMDYFGGHTLTENRPNVATIIVKGPMPLVTLSMSRQEFERLGLNRKLKFSARPAIYDGRRIEDGKRTEIEGEIGSAPSSTSITGSEQLTAEESALIMKAVGQNPNLRARGAVNNEEASQMASTARRRTVKAGGEILRAGDVGDAFYVVAKGSFHVFPGSAGHGGHQSVEALIASCKVSERLGRKERFLLGVVRKSSSLYSAGSFSRQALSEVPKTLESRGTGAQSMIAPPKALEPNSNRLMRLGDDRNPALWLRAVSESNSSALSPFKKGDLVARVVAGDEQEDLIKETGTVIEISEPGPEGKVMVEFDETEDAPRRRCNACPGVCECAPACCPSRTLCIKVVQLRPVEKEEPIAVLQEGECIGELALLYNTRQLCTYRAQTDCEVFAIDRRAFKKCFGRESKDHKDVEQLLDEVNLLTTLLVSERAEIARNARGYDFFQAGDQIIKEGPVVGEPMWYVVASGVCIATKASDRSYRRELRHGLEFGSRQALGNLEEYDMSVAAGPGGAKLLVVPGSILRSSSLVSEGDHTSPTSQTFGFSNASRTATPLDMGTGLIPLQPFPTPLILGALGQRMLSPTENLVPSMALEKLEPVALLGEGGFGSVFLVRAAGTEYALKRMSKGYVTQQGMQKQIVSERDILSMVDSRFIVHFIRTYRDDQFLYMLMEFAAGGHLYSLMNDRPYVLQRDEPRGSSAMFYVACVTGALEHMHERRIVYRDLKPENVLLDNHGYAKICDLGFARFILGKTKTMVGTPEYMAPEMIDAPHAHDIGVDWWALGVLTFEMLTGQVPWDDQGASSNTIGLLLTIRKGQDSGLPERLLPSGLILAKDFVKKLLMVDEEKRAGRHGDGSEIRQHPWFTYSRFDFSALAQGKLKSPYKSPRKVVERLVHGMERPWALEDNEDNLFVEYQDDESGWDDSF